MAFAVASSEKTFTIMFIAGLIAILFAVVSVEGRCISSCGSLNDGKYQSCQGCGVYANCSGGNITVLDCNGTQKWDDFFKQCRDTSTTCCSEDHCISSCAEYPDIPDGNYQSCETCMGFIACVGANVQYNMTCGTDTVWDDREKECKHNSTTCP